MQIVIIKFITVIKIIRTNCKSFSVIIYFLNFMIWKNKKISLYNEIKSKRYFKFIFEFNNKTTSLENKILNKINKNQYCFYIIRKLNFFFIFKI